MVVRSLHCHFENFPLAYNYYNGFAKAITTDYEANAIEQHYYAVPMYYVVVNQGPM